MSSSSNSTASIVLRLLDGHQTAYTIVHGQLLSPPIALKNSAQSDQSARKPALYLGTTATIAAWLNTIDRPFEVTLTHGRRGEVGRGEKRSKKGGMLLEK